MKSVIFIGNIKLEEKTLPEILYHYTSQDGLIGIIREQALWATKIQYMNDASELVEPTQRAQYILKVTARQIEKEISTEKEARKQIIDLMLAAFGDYFSISTNVFVVSFCMEGDLLSQWRGYGTPGSAYSIGFNTSKLVENQKSLFSRLYRCQYFDKESYYQKIDNLISEVFEQSLTNIEHGNHFIAEFLNLAISMKFQCFQSENEWRLVSRPINFDDGRLSFRVGKSMIIPYLPIPIDLSSIEEINIGPCQHPDLARIAIRDMAFKFGLSNAEIKNSQIPYRIF